MLIAPLKVKQGNCTPKIVERKKLAKIMCVIKVIRVMKGEELYRESYD